MSDAPLRQTHYTIEEYLDLEQHAATKHEYADGTIYAMAGGTPAHAQLAANVIIQLGPQLKRSGCAVFTSDLRVRSDSGLWTYPDVSVVCGPLRYAWPMADENRVTITNPSLVVEVTSDSTEDYDRGVKLTHYQQTPSVQTVLFVSHRVPRLTAHDRGRSLWRLVREAGTGDVLELGSGVTLAVDDVYAGVDL